MGGGFLISELPFTKYKYYCPPVNHQVNLPVAVFEMDARISLPPKQREQNSDTVKPVGVVRNLHNPECFRRTIARTHPLFTGSR